MTTSTSLDAIDLSDHDAFVDHVPHEWFAELRANDPVHWNEEPDGGRGFWAVTRYEDIRHVHRDVETFSSELGGTSLEESLDALEADEVLIDAVGPEIVAPFLAMKRFEIERHRAFVSEWELNEYLHHL